MDFFCSFALSRGFDDRFNIVNIMIFLPKIDAHGQRAPRWTKNMARVRFPQPFLYGKRSMLIQEASLLWTPVAQSRDQR